MAGSDYDAIKPHAIMVEFLFQGHINPFVNLAVALASKGCTVTYVQTEFAHHQISWAADHEPDLPFSGARESGLDIRHTTISDGFPLDFDRELHFVEFYESIVRDFPDRVAQLVEQIVESERRQRSTPFLLADTTYMWPAEVAAKYNLVYVSFWTSPALRLSIGYHLALLNENWIECSYDNYMDHIQELRGVKSSYVRDFIKYFPPKDDPFVPSILRETIIKAHLEVRKAHFILCNTVEELESHTISTLNQNQHLPTYAIGPTNFLARNCNQTPKSSSLRPKVDCTEWLGSKPPKSVLFIAFGSIAPAEKQFIHELAHGLRGSCANFLWVLRPDSVITDDETDVLPLGFVDDVAGRGLIVPWCDQCKVLSSPAVGGFLTHCGWNSILESMRFGVPMICYPIFMDQPTNRNMVVYDWKIGINLCDKELISREEVGEKIDRLMNGTELEELRIEMKKVNKIVQNALEENGSSDENLDRFLKDLKDKIYMLEKRNLRMLDENIRRI